MTFTNTRFQRNISREANAQSRTFWNYIHVDIPLLMAILLLISLGLVILYSASTKNMVVLENQLFRIGISLIIMFIFAQIPPIVYQRWAIWLYFSGIILLVAVLIFGHVGKGAERWLSLGFIRIQPSEMMKLAIPMVLAWYFHKAHLPLTLKSIGVAFVMISIPALLAAKQPDFGTAILLVVAGGSVLFLAGLSWRFMGSIVALAAMSAPVIWYLMHDYQKQRVLTFINPEHDPLGTGYHIIQSKIAIGSGGFFGKGWLNGTQSHLQFLPEHSTDFIFAVCSEEFGFMGDLILISLYMCIILRGLYITINGQDTFSRLLAGSLTLTFFVSFFINMGMVTGMLPVVGLPLPLVSYGGSSMVTLMASFGILMSIQTHRKLLTT
jgi:rod shape determining protein RodA